MVPLAPLVALASTTSFAFGADIGIDSVSVSGNVTMVQVLPKNDPALVFSKDKKGWTPLHYAVVYGHQDVVKLLLASNAQVDAKSGNDGWTPLDYAVYFGHKDLAELLLASNANGRPIIPATGSALRSHPLRCRSLRPGAISIDGFGSNRKEILPQRQRASYKYSLSWVGCNGRF